MLYKIQEHPLLPLDFRFFLDYQYPYLENGSCGTRSRLDDDMHIFTPVLALLATLDFGAEARSGFRTVTATSPLQTRGLETRTVKKQCNRLAVCAADTVTKLESRSPKKKVDADNYKPKNPIIFEVGTGSNFSLIHFEKSRDANKVFFRGVWTYATESGLATAIPKNAATTVTP